jgi:hypothetical protein
VNHTRLVGFAKQLARTSGLPDLYRAYLEHRYERRWDKGERSGAAPTSLKRQTVRRYGEAYKMDTLIETGTYLGEMVEAQRLHFRRIVSVELDPTLAKRARRLFHGRTEIEIREGDSARELPTILATLDRPALFWLDAHYSGGMTAKGDVETPIGTELRCILAHDFGDRHVILIDDARLFNGTKDYPTATEVRELVVSLRPNCIVDVIDDIIRVHALRQR